MNNYDQQLHSSKSASTSDTSTTTSTTTSTSNNNNNNNNNNNKKKKFPLNYFNVYFVMKHSAVAKLKKSNKLSLQGKLSICSGAFNHITWSSSAGLPSCHGKADVHRFSEHFKNLSFMLTWRWRRKLRWGEINLSTSVSKVKNKLWKAFYLWIWTPKK